jgi:HEAT repeat protein
VKAATSLVLPLLAFSLLTPPFSARAGEPPAASFDGARWIWFGGEESRKAPAATRYFRYTLTLPADLKSPKAHALVTADNLWILFVNGRLAGESEPGNGAWRTPKRLDISALLWPGQNIIAIEAVNTLPGAAGLLAKIVIHTGKGEPVVLPTDDKWRSSDKPGEGWQGHDFTDADWLPAKIIGEVGCAPWKKLNPPKATPEAPPARLNDPKLAAGIVFLRGNVPKPHHFAFTVGGGKQRQALHLKAYPENDVPAPAVLGRQMFALAPARPGVEPKLLLDAGNGSLGSPSVSFDGQTIYFAMAPTGEAFYHIYRIAAGGGAPEQLTRGPFHDYDPEPLPDGRIAFSSTRLGSREEYHSNLASSIFTMSADGSAIQPLTYHIVSDREPRVTAAGSLVVVRSDNFLERAKVETQLHHLRLDGTGGVVLLGNDRGTLGYDRATANEGPVIPPLLRNNGFGSLAPLPDGRIAALSRDGLVLTGANTGDGQKLKTSAMLFDIAPLPDGRLLCTTYDRKQLGVVELASGHVAPFLASKIPDLHSPVALGPRVKPPVIASSVRDGGGDTGDDLGRTGYLYCQSVLNTKQSNVDVRRIRAVRIYEGSPLALRSDHYPYVHIGVEARELGTVPLGADGSFYARVPADRALAMQAVDAEGRSIVNELTWIYVRPGEQRSCVGCHSPRATSPPPITGQTLYAKAVDVLGTGAPHRFRGNNAELGGILNLQLDRFREAASINLHTQQPLAAEQAGKPLPPGRAALVESLCRQLTAADAGSKISALQRLALLHDRAAVPAVARALGDADDAVRMNAALTLAACGTRDAVPPLVKTLADKEPHVARAAQIALGHLTGQRGDFKAQPDWNAIEAAFIQQIGTGDSTAADGGARLRRASAASKKPSSASGVSTESRPTDITAIQSLGHIGGDAAKRALQNFLQRELAADNPASDARAAIEAMRALGHLRAADAVPLLASALVPDVGSEGRKNPRARRNVHLAAGAAEALGWIGSPEAENTLLEACPKLQPFWVYTQICGDHPVLRECHSSPLHFRILEALDAIGSRDASVIGAFLRSVPGDLDRGLLVEPDAYETLVSRVAQRAGLTTALLETCLGVLGDAEARSARMLRDDLTAYPLPHGADKRGKSLDDLFKVARGGLTFLPYTPEMRAAQMISVLALDTRLAPRIAATFERHRRQQISADENFKAARNRAWACFYLARALGKIQARETLPVLLASLDQDTEGKYGFTPAPSPFTFKQITPFPRAAVAFALGEIGDPRATPSLMKCVANFDNALDVRHSAARALTKLCAPADLPALEKLAADYPEVATRRLLLAACQRAKSPTPRLAQQ